jgi:hypothetical protein
MGPRQTKTSWASPAIGLVVACCVALTAIAPTVAQDRSTVVRVLEEGSDFRARVRAAGALGSSGDPRMADALVRALAHDENAAVRAACAEGLGRLGVASTRAALDRATHDASSSVRDAATRALRTMAASAPPAPAPAIPSAPPSVASGAVDWAHTSYVVFVGSLSDRSGFGHARLVTVMGTEMRRALGGVHGTVVLGASDPRTTADRECAARHIPQFRIDGSIAHVQGATAGRDLRVRAEVSLVVMDEQTRNIRASLNGAATGSEPAPTTAARPARERYLAEQALTSATRSAMTGASRAMGH